MSKIDIKLTRDPRWVAAEARLTEIKTELNSLERQRGDVEAGLNKIGYAARDQIYDEALALVAGTQAPDPALVKRETLMKTLDGLTHRLAVVRQAAVLQRQALDNLRSEISKAIATELLPEHQSNVREIVKAALALEHALQVEHSLRDKLTEAGVLFSGVMRAMPLGGFGLLRDDQSRISRYLLEAHEYEFIAASDLPAIVRNRIPPKPSKPVSAKTQSNAPAGWAA